MKLKILKETGILRMKEICVVGMCIVEEEKNITWPVLELQESSLGLNNSF